jgi:predicted  nucleic acid-binding Zn-ribbon protein
MYFILVVALLIIVANNGDKVDNLQADLDSANTEISTLETTLEAAANEIAVRDDAITGWEADSAAVNAKLNDSDSLRGELEMEVADLQTRLSASASALDASSSALNDAIANPVCSACPDLECPLPEPTATE